MRISLIDVDGRNYPNLALMRLSAWHKAQGDSVEWYLPLLSHPDKIYASKIFTYKKDYTDYAACDPEPVRGGTGYGMYDNLPPEVEQMPPDYSIYPQFSDAYGFLTRGCIRSCPWCIVPLKEGAIRADRDISEVAGDRKSVILMDNNFLAADPSFVCEQLDKIAKMKLRIDFNQGLDARLITSENARMLAACRWIRYIRFSCDTAAMIPSIKSAVALLREAGYQRKEGFFCYMLIREIDDAEIRLKALLQLDIHPFGQAYRDFINHQEPTAEQKLFEQYVNIKGGKYIRKIPFRQYRHL